MPLRLRLALLFTVAAAAVITVVGLAFYVQLRASLDASLDTSLGARADALSARLGAVTANPAGVHAAVDGSEEIAQVLDQSGNLVATSSEAGAEPLIAGPKLAAARNGPVFFTAEVRDRRSRVRAAPVQVGTEPATPVVALVGSPTDITDRAEDHVRDIMLIATAPAIIVAGLGAWALSGAALRPVERMRRQADQISANDPSGRLAVPSTNDEIAALARTMNDMLGRMRAALARERGFVADAGHELRTPLSVLKVELELAGRPGRSRQDLVEAVAGAAAETERLVSLSETLLLLARLDEGQRLVGSTVDLGAVLATAVKAVATRAADRKVAVRLTVSGTDDGLIVSGDADLLRQAVDNLVGNALRYAPADSEIEVVGQAGPEPGWVTVRVADRGPGFPPSFLPHAFERFRRADPSRARSGGGAGLGLAIVRSITTAHGGRATASNRPGGGAEVLLHLPADPSRAGG